MGRFTFRHILAPVGRALTTAARFLFITLPREFYHIVLVPTGRALASGGRAIHDGGRAIANGAIAGGRAIRDGAEWIGYQIAALPGAIREGLGLKGRVST